MVLDGNKYIFVNVMERIKKGIFHIENPQSARFESLNHVIRIVLSIWWQRKQPKTEKSQCKELVYYIEAITI